MCQVDLGSHVKRGQALLTYHRLGDLHTGWLNLKITWTQKYDEKKEYLVD
jgi:hypothetical protein